MKFNASIVFGAFKYWMQNGKTMTALIVGVVLGLAKMNGINITEANLDMLLEFLTAFAPFFAILFAGISDKVRKTLVGLAIENKE